MGLREQAAADVRAILEDTAAGFGVAITITSPLGQVEELAGFTNDIWQAIDPQTGMVVTSREPSAVLPKAALLEKFGELPRSIADPKRSPWLVSFADNAGKRHTLKVREARPDDANNMVALLLETIDGASSED